MPHRAGLRQTNVVAAALRLVDEEGAERLSLGRLAERLGVRTPSLYNHIAGLPGLKRDLTLYCLRDLLEYFTQTLGATADASPADAIRAFADAYRAYARQTPGRYALTLAAPAAGDAEVESVANELVGIAQAALAPYGLSQEDAIHAIRGLRSVVHGFIALEAAGAFGLPVDLEDSFHWLVDLFIAGLGEPIEPGKRQRVVADRLN